MSGGPVGDDLVSAFASLDTSSISDALDRFGIDGQPVGIRPVDPSFSLCGTAWTIRYIPIDDARSGTVGDFLDDVPPGSVVVIDNGGRLDATVWGDLMTIVAHRNGLHGTVIDGVSRDTARAVELDYPIFARSTFMRTGKDRVTLGSVGQPISLRGHRVDPGDIVVGDRDGVVVVPRTRAGEVLAAARAIAAAEEGIREALRQGARLAEARHEFGYHKLQSVER
jgi:regulator of RNase E activity RraA